MKVKQSDTDGQGVNVGGGSGAVIWSSVSQTLKPYKTKVLKPYNTKVLKPYKTKVRTALLNNKHTDFCTHKKRSFVG